MKVISFSLWGNSNKYIGGAKPNMEFAKKHYPGWDLRVHCEPQHADFMASLGYQVRTKTVTRGSWEGLFWRFEPLADPAVDVFISRDLDSRLNPREAAAVQEWLDSGKFAHVMRDHILHHVPILGGMWGCHHNAEFAETFMSMLNHWHIWDRLGADQDFLAEHVWHMIEYRTMIHDSAHKVPGVKDFPKHEPMDPKTYGVEVGAVIMP